MACTCPLLPDISDGIVTQPEVATVGTTASYKCNPTFSLNWPPFRTCLPDGTWDQREPTCRSECIHTSQRSHTACFNVKYAHSHVSKPTQCEKKKWQANQEKGDCVNGEINNFNWTDSPMFGKIQAQITQPSLCIAN